ncbi:hypothetical protein GWO43_24850 [candidate division KSB1 bacterium]|nr:hypothetical protein [candidate division KSB1 bacterium]NIR68669.1 hypothetical protein [candidate division KSB1 bacterium]NIS27158.1 hypothetical protein [candidate division KSB1 bacterium]NIT74044.1 hypothetical protein [candidate division KSB1 bacterium]NIU27910.1 hypothetical protein [candidate division KSB1 bacterium]
MKSQLLFAAFVLGLFSAGCVKRIPAYDEARKPISEREISHHKSNKNLLFYTLGGGSLSFGTGFFIGTLVDRGLDDDRNDAALWGTAAAGAVIGSVIFARQGSIKDRNQAIETIKEIRKEKAAKRLTEIKSRRKKMEKERKSLEEIRKQQEAERERLKEKIEKKKKDPPIR